VALPEARQNVFEQVTGLRSLKLPVRGGIPGGLSPFSHQELRIKTATLSRSGLLSL
jgi:hypothetical protein